MELRYARNFSGDHHNGIWGVAVTNNPTLTATDTFTWTVTAPDLPPAAPTGLAATGSERYVRLAGLAALLTGAMLQRFRGDRILVALGLIVAMGFLSSFVAQVTVAPLAVCGTPALSVALIA